MSAADGGNDKKFYEFGPFRVDPDKETVVREGEIVPLTPKTFQILLVLVRNSTEVVTKDELLKQVWPDTFVEESNLSRNIFLLRKALGESPQDHQYILTVPGKGYRLTENVRLVPEHQQVSIIASQKTNLEIQVEERKPWGWVAAGALLVILIIAGVGGWRLTHRKPVVADKVTVVIGDFENSTGDSVFDGTLRQGLSVQLEQSPFLSVVSEARIRQTLTLMGKTTDQRMTPEISREVCQRTGSVAVVNGTIATLGSEYILGLRLVACHTGDVFADEQQTAGSKEKTLAALDQAAVKVREKLGESLNTLQKFDTPLEQATTNSLEALQAYTLGRRMMVGLDRFRDAIPYFQRAIQLDQNFAMAYAALSSCETTMGDFERSREHGRRAYDLRANLSQPEKFYVESTYFHYVIADLDKARQVYELSEQIYPSYTGTHLRLWLLYSELGKPEKALAEIREAIRLDPARTVDYANLVQNYTDLGRFQEARTTINEMLAKNMNPPELALRIYLLDFLDGNRADMQEQVGRVAGQPGVEDLLLELECETYSSSGSMKQAREFSQRAMQSTLHIQQTEVAATFEANQSLWEALVGNKKEAREHADSATAISTSQQVLSAAGLGLAYIGEISRAQAIADDLAKRFPDDTRVQFGSIPSIRALIALRHNDSHQAIALLQPAAPYELGSIGWNRAGVVYIRGQAYLAAHQWTEAEGEFQKILDHRGIVLNHPVGSLAHLQLARAYAGAGDNARAKIAYKDFLALWSGADAPLLKTAQGEYFQLQSDAHSRR